MVSEADAEETPESLAAVWGGGVVGGRGPAGGRIPWEGGDIVEICWA